jgi:hypothetical protein
VQRLIEFAIRSQPLSPKGYRRDNATAPKAFALHGGQAEQAATTNRYRSEFLSMLKPVEIRRAMKCGAGLCVGI